MVKTNLCGVGRWLTGRVRVRVAVLTAVVVVAGWLLFGFQSSAQSHYVRAERASRLQSVATSLDRDEWQARAAGALTPALDAAVRRDLAAADSTIAQLATSDAVGRRIDPPFQEYREAIGVELAFFRAGQVRLANEVDTGRVDPTHTRLQTVLAHEVARSRAAAESASAMLRLGSAIVLLSAGSVIALLVWIGNRRRLRTMALTERTRVLAASERRFRALIDHGDDIIVVTDRDGVVHDVTDSAKRVLGLSQERVIGRSIVDFVHPDETLAARAELEHSLVHGTAGPNVWRCRDGAGAWRYIEVSITNLLDLPEVAGVVLNVRDVTDRHQLEVELRHRAFHDALTGLANRALMRDRIAHAMARRGDQSAALLLLDLDGFKHLNDSLGHLAGDRALVVIADRLRAVSRPADTVGRLGGDEFALLIEDAPTREEVAALAARVITAISEPFDWQDLQVAVGASVGVAFVEPGLPGADDLVRNADVALYTAKGTGRGRVCFFAPSMFHVTEHRFQLESELRQAVLRDEFVLQYQPIIVLGTGEVVGAEALVRWEHPVRGRIPPARFIEIAEETGLIVPIGRWVLDRACRDCADWTDAHPDLAPRSVSVNLSARQLDTPEIVADVAAALSAADLDPAQLVLEITETALMRDSRAALDRLHELKALGVHLAVDDFGTGYSSLSYLRQFPVDTVKIDKSFVDNVGNGGDDATFLEAILRLGETLHLKTLAEGIETQEQAAALDELGCQLGQGFHYARPVDGFGEDVDAFERVGGAAN